LQDDPTTATQAACRGLSHAPARGPITTPNENAARIKPKEAPRCCGGIRSATYARQRDTHEKAPTMDCINIASKLLFDAHSIRLLMQPLEKVAANVRTSSVVPKKMKERLEMMRSLLYYPTNTEAPEGRAPELESTRRVRCPA
jgi:hypothetical protein